MPHKKILLFHTLLFLISVHLFNRETLDYKSFVWFALVSNFLISVLALIATAVSILFRNDAGIVKNLIKTILSTIPLVIFHLFAATFLSFFAPWPELSLMTSARTLKEDIPWSDVRHLLETYLPFYLPYLLTKSILFFVPRSSLYGGFIHIRDAVLLTGASAAVPLALLKLSESFPLDFNKASFIGIALILFMPWPLFFSRDTSAHMEDKVPLFKATYKFPVEVVERGPRGWGFLFMAMGLIFVFCSLFAFNQKFDFPSLIALIFFFPFFLVGSLFLIVGLNMQWAEKEVTITREVVSGCVRMFIPWPKTVTWKKSLAEYAPPTKHIRYHRRDSDTGVRATYEIKMNLKTQLKRKKFSFIPDQNVVLYRAYHPENLDQELDQYRNLLR